jgi:Mg-chelatase subunit ChlI
VHAVEGVLITGVYGSGKSSVAVEIAYLLEQPGARHRTPVAFPEQPRSIMVKGCPEKPTRASWGQLEGTWPVWLRRMAAGVATGK